MTSIILTVDDHRGVRAALRSWLRLHYPEATLLTASTGEEAVKLVEAAAPDVVLMDIALPRMNGIEATLELRRREPEIKVVMVTAYDVPLYRRQAEAAGACAYVLKDRLGAELEAVLDRLLPHESESARGGFGGGESR